MFPRFYDMITFFEYFPSRLEEFEAVFIHVNSNCGVCEFSELKKNARQVIHNDVHWTGFLSDLKKKILCWRSASSWPATLSTNKKTFAFKAHLLANFKYNFPIESDWSQFLTKNFRLFAGWKHSCNSEERTRFGARRNCRSKCEARRRWCAVSKIRIRI